MTDIRVDILYKIHYHEILGNFRPKMAKNKANLHIAQICAWAFDLYKYHHFNCANYTINKTILYVNIAPFVATKH